MRDSAALASARNASSCSRARSIASGSVCVQRARVIGAAPGWWSGVAWPISTDATLGLTPAASSHVAAVWRHS
jgi:hypothetical protein